MPAKPTVFISYRRSDSSAIGVFRIDLLPPDVPEATAFQVQGTLNP